MSRAPDALAVALDAAHERARRAYAQRDAAAYMAIFDADLAYTRLDGEVIGRERLARDVRAQLARVHRAASEYRRESLEARGADEAVEVIEQRATYAVRAFWVLHREWTVRRRGRYGWVHAASAWQIREVRVLAEEVAASRTWLGLR